MLPPTVKQRCRLTFSESSCCDASAKHLFCAHVVADVAVYSRLVPIIALRARRRGRGGRAAIAGRSSIGNRHNDAVCVAPRELLNAVELLSQLQGGGRTMYPELFEEGRWSHETRSFFRQLARARVRCERPVMWRRAEQAWRMRWGAMFACTAARAVASSLLEILHSHGAMVGPRQRMRRKATTVTLGWWGELLSRDSVVHALSQFF